MGALLSPPIILQVAAEGMSACLVFAFLYCVPKQEVSRLGPGLGLCDCVQKLCFHDKHESNDLGIENCGCKLALGFQFWFSIILIYNTDIGIN